MRRFSHKKVSRRYEIFTANNIINGKPLDVKARMLDKWSDNVAWIGTGLLMIGPYLLGYKIGFIINAVGITLLTPQVYKAKQWNLVILNVTSTTGYLLQIFNII